MMMVTLFQAEGEDSLKKMQLMELAILNGTYRDANIKQCKTTPNERPFRDQSETRQRPEKVQPETKQRQPINDQPDTGQRLDRDQSKSRQQPAR